MATMPGTSLLLTAWRRTPSICARPGCARTRRGARTVAPPSEAVLPMASPFRRSRRVCDVDAMAQFLPPASARRLRLRSQQCPVHPDGRHPALRRQDGADGRSKSRYPAVLVEQAPACAAGGSPNQLPYDAMVNPPRSRTLPDLLDEIAARHPEREFIVGGSVRLSYAQTRARVRQLARGLRQLGVRRGASVALVKETRPEWLLIDFAVTLRGATLVPLSTWSRPRELAFVLDHCDATTLITIDRLGGQHYLGMLAELGGPGSARLARLRRVVVAGDERHGAVTPFDTLWDLGAPIADAELDAAQAAVRPDDVAYI